MMMVMPQSSANAVDVLKWVMVHISLWTNPTLDLLKEEAVICLRRSLLVTDSKRLYDASMSWTSGLAIKEKNGNRRDRREPEASSNGKLQVLDEQPTTPGRGPHQTSAKQWFADLLWYGMVWSH